MAQRHPRKVRAPQSTVLGNTQAGWPPPAAPVMGSAGQTPPGARPSRREGA